MMESDEYGEGIYCCSHCRLRKSECRCTDETPWASNRIAVWVERAVYHASWSNWGVPLP